MKRTSIGLSANITNFVRQDVRIPKSKPLLPIFEAVSNSLDSIADRPGKGLIRITVKRETDLVDGDRGLPKAFIIEDNGVGFNTTNMEAFDQLYSDHKASAGGKGRGRFAFLKVFSKAQIVSAFEEDGELLCRDFTFDLRYTGNDDTVREHVGLVKTVITLSDMREEFSKEIPKDCNILARELISHFLPVILSDRDIEIVLDDGEEIYLKQFFVTRSMVEQERTLFSIGQRSFSLLLVKVRPRSGFRHKLILAASAREVRGDALEKYIPVLAAGPLSFPSEPEGFFFVSIVEGEFLDEKVDPMRVDFTDDDFR